MFGFVKQWFRRPPETVVLNEEGVRRTLSDGRVESVRWEALREVFILTTGDGPWANDVFWVLVDEGGGCVVPSEAECAQALLARLQALPGFDNHKVVEAMGCAEEARFDVWQRASEAAAQ